METKKIDKRFYLLSSFNIIPAIILGGGLTQDSLVLIVALAVLVLNHTILVKIVQSVVASQTGAPQSPARILILMGLKFLLLFTVVMLTYLYNKELITKLFMIIFFQLIIQLVSIKNNYQK